MTLINSFVQIMTTLVSFILICLINSIRCLSCIQSKKINSFVLNPFKELEFYNTLNNLTSTPNVRKSECHLKLTISYTDQRFDIGFPETSSTGGDYNEIQVTFLSIDRPLINQSVILNIIYTCTSENDCNRNYALQQMTSIIVMNYSGVQEKLFQILAKKQQSKLSCSINIHLYGRCSVKLCVAVETNGGQFDESCGSKKSDITEVNLIVRKKEDDIKALIKYVCNFNYCNGAKISKDIKDTVRSFHQQLSKLFDLPKKVIYRLTTDTTATKSNNGIIQTKISIYLFTTFLFVFI